MVGLSRPQDIEETQAIASQWEQFKTLYKEIPNKTALVPLGITMNMDEDGRFDYVCAAEVSRVSSDRESLVDLQVPKQTYAVFTHRGASPR